MAKKEKKVSINKLESTMRDNKVTVAFTEDEDITINTVLSFKQVVQFVDDVVSSVVDSETGSYLPEVFGLAFRRAVLTYFANFNMPDSVEKMYDLLYNTRAYNLVVSEIDDCYLNDIKNAIDKKISFELELIKSNAARDTRELINTLKSVTDEMHGVFGDLPQENITALVNSLSAVGQLDEAKLAKAVLDYSAGADNTDNKTPIKLIGGDTDK